jgi:putative hydrolase of the HAD superfamily
MRFRAVVFDAAETLFTTRGSVGEIYSAIARLYGSKADAETVQAAFLRHFQGAGPISVKDQKRWWRDVVHRVFSDVGMIRDFDAFFNRVYDEFRGSQGWMLFPETLEVLSELKRLGLELGIVSNFDTRIYSVIKSLGIDHFFDVITISSEAGHAKPDLEIFKSAAHALGVPPQTILMVGDSPHDDIEPALQAGLAAILLDRKNRHAAKSHLRRISSLTEVLSEVTS